MNDPTKTYDFCLEIAGFCIIKAQFGANGNDIEGSVRPSSNAPTDRSVANPPFTTEEVYDAARSVFGRHPFWFCEGRIFLGHDGPRESYVVFQFRRQSVSAATFFGPMYFLIGLQEEIMEELERVRAAAANTAA